MSTFEELVKIFPRCLEERYNFTMSRLPDGIKFVFASSELKWRDGRFSEGGKPVNSAMGWHMVVSGIWQAGHSPASNDTALEKAIVAIWQGKEREMEKCVSGLTAASREYFGRFRDKWKAGEAPMTSYTNPYVWDLPAEAKCVSLDGNIVRVNGHSVNDVPPQMLSIREWGLFREGKDHGTFTDGELEVSFPLGPVFALSGLSINDDDRVLSRDLGRNSARLPEAMRDAFWKSRNVRLHLLEDAYLENPFMDRVAEAISKGCPARCHARYQGGDWETSLGMVNSRADDNMIYLTLRADGHHADLTVGWSPSETQFMPEIGSKTEGRRSLADHTSRMLKMLMTIDSPHAALMQERSKPVETLALPDSFSGVQPGIVKTAGI